VTRFSALAFFRTRRGSRATWSRALGAIGVVLVSACAQIPSQSPSTGAPVSIGDTFTAEGRLSARHGSNGVAGNFAWTRDGVRDSIDLATPLGQTIARLTGDGERVRIELPDGRVATAADWDSLTQTEFGSPIPVRGLSSWLRARPRRGSTADVERDAKGRPSVIRQDGWEIVYAYADDAAVLPSRLSLRYSADPTIEVRIAIDRWQ